MMSNGGFHDEAGQVCRARVQIPQVCRAPDETRYTLSLPTHTENDVLRFDAQRLIGLRPDPYQRLNATYTPMTLRAAGPRGPRIKCRLG